MSNNRTCSDHPLVAAPARRSTRVVSGSWCSTHPAKSRHSRENLDRTRLEITAAKVVHAGVDGEAMDLSSPLRFVLHPLALRVLISSRHPGMSPSARPVSLHLP